MSLRILGLVVLSVSLPWLVGVQSSGEQNYEEVISAYMVLPESTEQMDAIAEQFEVHHRHGDKFEVYVLREHREKFLALAPQAELYLADINADLKLRRHTEGLDGYRSFEEVEDYLEELAERYPDLVQLDTYGLSQQGRPLYVLKVSDNVTVDEDEPELMLTSATHGDELITVEVVLRLLDELLEGHGTDPRLTAMIDERELFFMPVVNPDGFSRQQRYANGVDPNREYPWPERVQRDPVASIAAQIDWFHTRDIVGDMDFHASGEMVMYPWAYTYAPLPADDMAAFDELGAKMAAENNYRMGQISKVIYVAKGSSCDYWYWQKGTKAMAIELARRKVPPASQIDSIVDDAREMTWQFIEHF